MDLANHPQNGDEGGSSYSMNTPNNQNYPFYIKAHYEQMISPESSGTPDVTSVMNQTVFNPADYTFEIQQLEESQMDYETSMISKDDTLSYIKMPFINNDLGYQTDNSRILSKPFHLKQQYSQMNVLSPMNKASTQILIKRAEQTGGTTTHQKRMSLFMGKKSGQLNQTTEKESQNLVPGRKNSQQNVNYITPLNGLKEYIYPKQVELDLNDESFTKIAGQEFAVSKISNDKIQGNGRPKFNGIIIQTDGEDKPVMQVIPQMDNSNNNERLHIVDQTPKKHLITHQETKFSQISSNYKDKDLDQDDFARAQTHAMNQIDLLHNNGKGSPLKHLLTSPNITEIQQITRANLMTLPTIQLLPQSSLSPISRRDSAMRSQRSITTVSAVSKKVGGKKIINQYIIINKKIGAGKFAKVAQVMDQNTKVMYAMKIMDKIKLKKIFVGKNKFAYQAVETEIAVLKLLEHENIVHLYEIIDDPKHDKLYLIQEYITNGTLQQRIVNKDPKIKDLLSEERCRKYFRQLISAVEYCHECAQIIHRDIKPENILIDSNDNVKLSDFGVSFMMENGSDQIETSAGSYYYFSPEACLGSTYKGRKSDIWACGVTLYYMTYKSYPFESSLIPELFAKIQNDEPTFRPSKSQPMAFDITNEMKDLIRRILVKNPENRLTIKQIKEHPWITKNGTDPMELLEICELEPTEADKQNVFKEISYVGTAVLRKLSKMIEEKQTVKVSHKQKVSQNSFLNIMKTAIANSVKDGGQSN